jgi:Tol biopolymer transport system component
MRRAMLLAAIAALTTSCDNVPPGAHAQRSGLQGIIPETFNTVTRRIAADPAISWRLSISPDGNSLAFVDWDTGDIVLRDLRTGEDRRLTAIENPWDVGYYYYETFSPDGRFVAVAYEHWPEGDVRSDVVLLPVDGGEPRMLRHDGPEWTAPVAWYPDGSAILATTGGGGPAARYHLIRLPLDGSPITTLMESTNVADEVAFSPDGRHLAYSRRTADTSATRHVYVRDLQSGRERRLNSYAGSESVLAWDPQTGALLISSDRSGTVGAWLQPMRDGAAAGLPTLVKPDLWRSSAIGMTRDGRLFYRVDSGGRHIHTVDFDPQTRRVMSEPVRLLQDLERTHVRMALSPDGESLAYLFHLDDIGASAGIGIRSMSTGQERVVPLRGFAHTGSPLGLFGGPTFQPTGDITFYGRRRDGETALFRVDDATGRIEERVAVDDPAHSLTGGRYVMRRDGGMAVIGTVTTSAGARRGLWVREPGEAALREVYALPNNADGRARMGAFNSDDYELRGNYFFVRDPGTPQMELVYLEQPGATPRTILRVAPGVPVDPRPHGQLGLVFYSAAAEESNLIELWTVRYDGSDPRPTGLKLPRGQPNYTVDAARGRIIFITGDRRTEVWSMENFR